MASARRAYLPLLALCLVLLRHAAAQQADERQLLLEIKRAWGDPPELATWSAATGSHCTAWAHVSCDGSGRVTSLALPNVTVSGPVPDAIGGLTSLATLDLSNTSVSGGFPASLYSCTGLTHLDLSMNKLSGDLPHDIGRLGNNLTYLALNSNGFTGEIPSDLANCPALTSLQLQDNDLCGEVPAALWSETKLMTLLLQNNGGLNGTLAETLSANMTTLSISNNKFTGTLPASAAKLQTLDAGSNSFSGEIPAGLAPGMPLLQELILSANKLSGAIPATIATLGGLTLMNFSRNQLTGEIPVALGYMPVLTLLDLSSNQLSGSIPPALALLRLNQLNLSSNELVGKVPAVLAVSAYDRSFLGNAALCTDTASPVSLAGLSSCAASSPGNVGLPFELLGTVCVVLVLVVALAFFIVRDIMKRKQVVPPEEGWKFTHFQPLDFVEAAVLVGLADENLIGKGGSGRVYRVECPSRSGAGDGTVVAVKRIQTGGKVDVLGHVRHTNIVKLLCCFSRAETKLVVYEYMGNGSLDKWLHGHRWAGSAAGLAMARAPSSVWRAPLDWPARVRVAVGAARGLCYMHHECSPPVVHGDVKCSNILLDSEQKAKVANLGLTRLLVEAAGTTPPDTMSAVAGTSGYMDPECAYTRNANEKVDVYSFGVVLLELATGREAGDGGEHGSLAEWSWRHLQSGKSIADVADECIGDAGHSNEFEAVFKLGVHRRAAVDAAGHERSAADSARVRAGAPVNGQRQEGLLV